MDKTRILSDMNACMMRDFSQRTVSGLNEYKLFRLLLPPFKSFLEFNLDKEINKHEEVVKCAVDAVTRGQAPDKLYTEQLLQKAREIDQTFLQKANMLSTALDIHYHEIDPIRQRRFEYLLNANYQVLLKWRDKMQFRNAVNELYSADEFRFFLQEILYLYVRETRLLSHSVKIPRRLSSVRTTLIDTVDKVMKKTADDLATDLTRTVFKYRP